MDKLKEVQEVLISAVADQVADLNRASAHELGEVVDIIKDIEEIEYYCSIIKAMEAGKTYIADKDKDIINMVSSKTKGEG